VKKSLTDIIHRPDADSGRAQRRVETAAMASRQRLYRSFAGL